MAKKSDAFYYDTFIAFAEYASKSAKLLDATMRAFDPAAIDTPLEQMHQFEQDADELHHELTDALVSAFITPIEREDIAFLGDSLDSLVDHLEGVIHRIYFTNVQTMRPSALEMSGKVVQACDQLCELMRELPRFKHSKSLRTLVIDINTIESDCDAVYIESMRELHTTVSDPIEVIAWRDIYTFLELCADSCERVAGTVENIVMTNS